MTSRAMVVVGGGSSARFGADKLRTDIAGRPLIEHTIDAVVGLVHSCVVVCRPELANALDRPDVIVALGGATRTSSEMAGLAALGDQVDLIGIHDAARPLVDPALVERLFVAAEAHGGAVPLLSYERLILDKASHEPITGLLGAQTPQVFRAPALLAAYARAARQGFDAHDTLEVMQRFGDVEIVGLPGDPGNIKVTYPEDLERVRALLSDSSHT
ncbi:MAG TPA: 2-C-methyl-D-erythritol 4-phosphate cytidylyltransferase [Acidimicrobiia bacterium]|nr:2-C-methyl-D-erythritol 4-phosphate cytidylyltransferase [Acidimicrobiia bacterium]